MLKILIAMPLTFTCRPPQSTFHAFDRFRSLLPPLGLHLNIPKSTVLLPPRPPRSLVVSCNERALTYSSSSIPALGAILSRDSKLVSRWLVSTTTSLHKPLFDMLQHPRLPFQHSFALLRLCTLPRMNYFSRIFTPDTFSAAAKAFDQSVVATFCMMLQLTSLSNEARTQLSLPIGDGGFGLRSMQIVSPAAWWSALAHAMPHIFPLLQFLLLSP